MSIWFGIAVAAGVFVALVLPHTEDKSQVFSEPNNGDMIRMMSDDQLAELLDSAYYGEYPARPGTEIFDWLNEKAIQTQKEG